MDQIEEDEMIRKHPMWHHSHIPRPMVQEMVCLAQELSPLLIGVVLALIGLFLKGFLPS